MSVNPIGPHTEDPNDPSACWVECVDGQGNDLGQMKLQQVAMSPQEFALETAYLANHPWISPGRFDHSWMTDEELMESLEKVHVQNRNGKEPITPSEYSQQMVDFVKQKRTR